VCETEAETVVCETEAETVLGLCLCPVETVDALWLCAGEGVSGRDGRGVSLLHTDSTGKTSGDTRTRKHTNAYLYTTEPHTPRHCNACGGAGDSGMGAEAESARGGGSQTRLDLDGWGEPDTSSPSIQSMSRQLSERERREERNGRSVSPAVSGKHAASTLDPAVASAPLNVSSACVHVRVRVWMCVRARVDVCARGRVCVRPCAARQPFICMWVVYFLFC